MGEFVKADPRRLRGAMLAPANHAEVAAAEMRWARENHNLSILYLNPTAPGEIPWSHASRDPFWQAVQDLGITVVFHESTTGAPPNASGIHRYVGHWSMIYLCTHVVEAELAIADIILGGTLQRFPGVKVGAAEAHIHWVPGWLRLMDQQFGAATKIWSDQSGETMLDLKPSEYFERQCFVAAFPDDDMVPEAIAAARESILVCSDWPHPVQSAYAVGGLEAFNMREDVSPTDRHKALISNPSRFLPAL
jgi:predicted TIM-barrel fold metal-dependent hydrolase